MIDFFSLLFAAMKTVVFALIIALTVGVIAQKLDTSLSFQGAHTQSAEGRKIAREDENSGKCGDNLSWVFNTQTSTLTISGQGYMSCCTSSSTPWSQFSNQVQNVEIQQGVSSIDNYAFYKSFTSLKTVNIKSNIVSIGTGAFQNCKNLTSINIPSSVKSIGTFAFYGCSSLTSITIPSGVTSINNYTFRGCFNLKTVNIKSNITSIGEYAFYSCKSLTSINIPSSVTSIGNNAFYECESLTSITIPSCVTKIFDYTFYGCTSLKIVNITSNITSIGKFAFEYCRNLTSIAIPSSVKSIDSGAFDQCSSLTFISIPSGVTSINPNTFNGCISLKTVNITSNITSIGYSAFYNCKNLTSIIIPSSVTSIGSSAFAGCNRLTSVIYLGSNDEIAKSATDIFSGCDKLKFVCVPSSYNSNSFCGLNQFCKHESCESFTFSANQCYEPVCNGNKTISMEKRENATMWESKSNGCYEFQCHNDSGPIYWKQCNKTDEVCEKDQCVVMKEVTYYIEIEVDGIDATNVNMTEIQITISDLTGIEEDKLKIHFDSNENNEIIRIIVIVDNEETADRISTSVNAVINEGLCENSSESRVKE